MALDHYVSQVHLKRFCDPAIGGLTHAVRKSDLKRFTPRPQDICRTKEGNTNKYLVNPRSVEDFIKTIEVKYSETIRLIKSGNINKLAVYVVSGFASYVMACSPTGLRINTTPLRGALESTARILDRNKQIPPSPPVLGGGSLSELLESGRVNFTIDDKYPQAICIENIIKSVLSFGNFYWDILINDNDNCQFFTSDYPIAIEKAEDPRIINRIIPLDPSLAVRIRPNIRLTHAERNSNFEHFKYRIRHVSRGETISINRAIIRSAENLVIFRDEKAWIDGFIRKNRPFRTTIKNYTFPTPRGELNISRQEIEKFNYNI